MATLLFNTSNLPVSLLQYELGTCNCSTVMPYTECFLGQEKPCSQCGKIKKSEAEITTQVISTFLWFFLFNVFFGYIWWQILVYFDLTAFSILQCSHKVEFPNPNLDFSSFLLLFFEVFVFIGSHSSECPPFSLPNTYSILFCE